MSLSDDLRNELAGIAPRQECDRLAELSGLFHAAGTVHLRGRGEVAVHLDLASSAVARRAFSLLRGFGVESEIRTYRRRSFERETRYQLHVAGGPHAVQVLHEAGVLAGLAEAEGVRLAVADRGRHAVAYAKGAEAIAGLLAAAGASDAVLVFEERAVLGSTRAAANRLANADHTNLVRTSRAAHEQLRAVRRLDLDELPPKLREIADLRLRHPTLSLRELALRCDPPATKSAAHRRLPHLVPLGGLFIFQKSNPVQFQKSSK